jgi:Cu(I)/Ag(I) efflux system membrane fusion protein
MKRTKRALRAIPIAGAVALSLLVAQTSVALASTEKFDKQMKPVLEQYLKIPAALAADRTEGVKQAAKQIKKLAAALDPTTVTGEHAGHYKDVPRDLAAAAAKMAKAKDIAAMREALKDLSKPMAMWATMSKPKGVSVVYCSMAPGSWLQRGTAIANPYYGAKMPRCGEIVAGPGSGKSGKGKKHGEMHDMKGMHSGHDMHGGRHGQEK